MVLVLIATMVAKASVALCALVSYFIFLIHFLFADRIRIFRIRNIFSSLQVVMNSINRRAVTHQEWSEIPFNWQFYTRS